MTANPVLFIGSSSEARAIGEMAKKQLRTVATVRPWWKAFDLGDSTIETLYRELDNADYALLIATPDDKVKTRGAEKITARDNVIFETGLFMGRLGRKRAFVLADSALDLPSDLFGVTVAIFHSTEGQINRESLDRAVESIKKAISKGIKEREIDFLRAYLEFIDPRKTRLWDTYADILTRHYETIKVEVDKLRVQENWFRLLKVKERLREYFEYSGMYREGIEFGKSYVEALQNLKMFKDAAWSQIKDVGYMLILSGRYDEGRAAIHEVIDNIGTWDQNGDQQAKAKLLFYGNRYLSISYYRDPARRNLDEAKQHLDAAERQLASFDPGCQEHSQLYARLLRNRGHLAMEDQAIEIAEEYYGHSLKIFNRLGDDEHIGTTHLAVAKALITQGLGNTEDPLQHLKTAEKLFARIGWLEGQARVKEQFARYFASLAQDREDAVQATNLLREGLDALESAEVIFEKVHSGRFFGRLDGVRQEMLALQRSIGKEGRTKPSNRPLNPSIRSG